MHFLLQLLLLFAPLLLFLSVFFVALRRSAATRLAGLATLPPGLAGLTTLPSSLAGLPALPPGLPGLRRKARRQEAGHGDGEQDYRDSLHEFLRNEWSRIINRQAKPAKG